MPVFSSGTANTVAFLNASKVLSSSTSLSFDGSNLGIGVASPAATLDVYGGASGRLQIYSSASGNFLTSKVAANTGYQILNYLGSQHVWGDGTSTTMKLDASGVLLVGHASNLTTGVRILSKGSILSTSSNFDNLSTGGGIAMFCDNANYGTIWALKNGNTAWGNIAIAPSGGNVGVGTSSPTTKLTVATPDGQTNAIDLIVTNGTSGNNGHIGSFADGTYISTNWYYAGSQLKNVSANGSSNVVITGASTDVGTYIAFGVGKTTDTSPVERMRIIAGGEVLVGTNTTQSSAGTTSKFVVYGATPTTAGDINLRLYDSGTSTILQLMRSGSAYNYAGIGASESAVYTTSTLNLTADGGIIKFSTGSTGSSAERARIDANGAAHFYTQGAAAYGGVNLTSADPFIRFTASGGTTDKKKWDIRAIGSSGSEALEFRTINDANTVFSTKLWISNAGKVGIGTTSPSTQLHVIGDARFENSGSGVFGLLSVGTAGGARDIFLAGQSGYSNGFTVRYTGSAMKYVFQDGNVGVGIVNPTATLDVAGGVSISGWSNNNSGSAGGMEIGWDGTQSLIQSYNRVGGAYTPLGFNGSKHVFSIGNVGIGTSNPVSALHVVGPVNNASTSAGVHAGLYAGTYAAIEMVSGSGTSGWIDFHDTAGSDYSERIRGGDGALKFLVNGSATPQAQILSNGVLYTKNPIVAGSGMTGENGNAVAAPYSMALPIGTYYNGSGYSNYAARLCKFPKNGADSRFVATIYSRGDFNYSYMVAETHIDVAVWSNSPGQYDFWARETSVMTDVRFALDSDGYLWYHFPQLWSQDHVMVITRMYNAELAITNTTYHNSTLPWKLITAGTQYNEENNWGS
jgi:hypothetical protein